MDYRFNSGKGMKLRILCITLLVSFLSVLRVQGQQSIVINEIQATNIDMFVDPSFNYGGWIELYNSGDQDVIINGWYISDSPNDLKKYKLCNGAQTIRAKGYKVFWFGHYDAVYSPNQIDSKLDVDGGNIYISNRMGNVICSVIYPEAVSRTSFARTTDGGNEWGTTAQPTPGKSNTTSTFATERLEAPVVNKDGGIYSSKITVRVTIPEGARLRYTNDGTTPTETNGILSTTGVIALNSTTVLRFRLFKDG